MQAGKRTLWISERLKGLFTSEVEHLAAETGKRRRVLDFFLVPGRVQSKLQDENGKFHRVELGMRQFSEEEWSTVCKEFAQHALFLASFLTSRIPEEAESLLRASGIALLPEKREDIQLSCDGEPLNPNNSAIVFTVFDRLLDRLDDDPFSIFVLRGKGREEMLLEIRRQRSEFERPDVQPFADADAEFVEKDGKEAETFDDFWRASPSMQELSYNIRADELPASLLKRLDQLPLGGAEDHIEPLIEDAYLRVARRAQAYGLELQDKDRDR